MAAATRIVERLHLRADSEPAVRRILPCLEDAFRTATLPDTAAQLIFVRRLHLGPLPRGASAQSLSLAIESRFRGGDWQPVHAAAAGAAGAPAVWFRDVLEAHEIAALRTVTGQPLDAWFWALALPALARSSSPDRLRTIVFSLASREEAPAALPAWTQSLARAGHVHQLIIALQPGDGAALLRAAGIAVPRPALDPGIDRRTPLPAHRAAPTGLEGHHMRAATAWPDAGDDRQEFIEQMLGGSASSCVSARQQPARAESELNARDVSVFSRQDSAHASTVSLDRGAHQPRAVSSGRHSPEQGSEPHNGFGGTREALAAASAPTTDPIEVARGPRPFIDAAPTGAGGLFFLIPVLERLGFPAWCATQQARADVFAQQIFRVLLSRLRVPDDDPAWMIAATPSGSRAPAAAFRLKPEATPIGEIADGWLPPLGGRTSRRIPNTAPEIWLGACRRLLRRRARIGLASLVLRHARVMVTATHIDVFFTLNAADVRVRRAGLDLTPGWVPWLRRVVSFHYGEPEFQDTAR